MRAQPKHQIAETGASRPERILPLDAPEADATGNAVHRYQNDLAARFAGEDGPSAAQTRIAPSAIVTVPLVLLGTAALLPIAIAAAAAGRIMRPARGSFGGDVTSAVGSLMLASRAAAGALATRRVSASR